MLTSINDLVFDHLFASSGGLLLVYPIRLVPVFFGDQTKLHRCICECSDTPMDGYDQRTH